VRDLGSPDSISLAELSCAADTKLITVKIDSTSDTDAVEAAQALSKDHEIKRLDVVVANAGSGDVYGDLATAKPQEIKDLVDVNGLGECIHFLNIRLLA
jgi:norsolorinic acid ketoreductase